MKLPVQRHRGQLASRSAAVTKMTASSAIIIASSWRPEKSAWKRVDTSSTGKSSQ